MTTYANLTPSAIRAACAENGASEMLVSGALILALLDAAERNERNERVIDSHICAFRLMWNHPYFDRNTYALIEIFAYPEVLK